MPRIEWQTLTLPSGAPADVWPGTYGSVEGYDFWVNRQLSYGEYYSVSVWDARGETPIEVLFERDLPSVQQARDVAETWLQDELNRRKQAEGAP